MGIPYSTGLRDISKCELQDGSPMREEFIQTPKELRDLLSYLGALSEN